MSVIIPIIIIKMVILLWFLTYLTTEEVEVLSVEHVDHGPPGSEDYVATAVRNMQYIRASMEQKPAELFTKKGFYTLHVRRLVYFDYELAWLIK